MSWVKCPVCGESGMRRIPEPDDPEKGYISCLNLNCGSNGGDDFSAANQPTKSAPRVHVYDAALGEEIMSLGKAVQRTSLDTSVRAAVVEAYGAMRAAQIARE